MDKKSILSEIKSLLFSQETEIVEEQKFADYKVGELTIRVDELAVGSQVSVVTEEGVIAAGPELAGEHILEDGTKIELDEAGLITEIEAPETTEEVVEEVVEEELKEEKEEMAEEEIKEEVKEEVKEEMEEEKEDKISALEEKVKKMEEAIEKMAEEAKKMEKDTEKYSKFSSDLLEKIDDFIKNTPAEMEFASIKSEYSKLVDDKKSAAKTNLESIRNLRKKQ